MKRKAKRITHKSRAATHKQSKLSPKDSNGFGFEMPPELDQVEIYFDQKGMAEFAELFFIQQENIGWKTPTGGIIRNWKVCAAEWIYNYRQDLKRELKRSPFATI